MAQVFQPMHNLQLNMTYLRLWVTRPPSKRWERYLFFYAVYAGQGDR